MTDNTKMPERIWAELDFDAFGDPKTMGSWHSKETEPCVEYIREDMAQAMVVAAMEQALEMPHRALTPDDARAALDRLIAEAERRGEEREREACAVLTENRITGNGIKNGKDIECEQIADAIRARKSSSAGED